MAKSRKNVYKNNKGKKGKTAGILKSVKNTTYKAIPVVKTSLKKVGSTVKTVAIKSAPAINKGIEGIYGTLATGFDLGVKGVEKGYSTVSKMSKKRRSKRNH